VNNTDSYVGAIAYKRGKVERIMSLCIGLGAP